MRRAGTRRDPREARLVPDGSGSRVAGRLVAGAVGALAITGIETASMMSGSLIRDTPPWARMSAGTRSRGHHCEGARALGDLGLVGGDDVHDDAALEHLGHARA